MLKKLPEELRLMAGENQAATLRVLNGFAIDLMAIPNVEDLFWYVAQKVVGKLGFVDCVMYRADEDQALLTQVAAWGVKNPFGRSIVNPLVIPFGKGITGRVAQEGDPLVVDDLLEDQEYIPDTELARSEICVPLVIGNRVVGVIDSEHPNPAAFGATELEILTTVAAMTSAKLALLEEAERSAHRYRDLAEAHVQLSQEKSTRKAIESELSEARRLETIGRLSGKFAHEFNNLLTVISGNLELLQCEATSPDNAALLADCRAAATRGAKLIQDMLAFSQRLRLSLDVSDMNNLVIDVCQRSDPARGNDVDLDLSDDLLPIAIDRQAFQGALINLLANARFVAPGSRIEVATRNVVLTGAGDHALSNDPGPGRYMRVDVRDSGPGISEDQLPRIFDPFYTTKPVGSGVGLGLSMVLGFVQQSGGAIGVDSGQGRGATFRLYFPAAENLNEVLTVSD